jgi:hypothetical protein
LGRSEAHLALCTFVTVAPQALPYCIMAACAFGFCCPRVCTARCHCCWGGWWAGQQLACWGTRPTSSRAPCWHGQWFSCPCPCVVAHLPLLCLPWVAGTCMHCEHSMLPLLVFDFTAFSGAWQQLHPWHFANTVHTTHCSVCTCGCCYSKPWLWPLQHVCGCPVAITIWCCCHDYF